MRFRDLIESSTPRFKMVPTLSQKLVKPVLAGVLTFINTSVEYLW